MDDKEMAAAAMIQSVTLDDANDTLVILDQTVLPNEKRFLPLKEMKEIWDAIYYLKVRGAPAIGIAAGYGLYLGVKASKATTMEQLAEDFKQVKDYLASSRPTAVNLFWALDRMEARFKQEQGRSIAEIKAALREEAEAIRVEDEQVCERIGRYALSLLEPGWGILTHCNAGAIATAKYGTALAPIYLGHEQGYGFKVYADETRPLLQGARLTAWELHEAGIDVTLICDNMASIVMKEGKIQAILVGCDRVAANGDTANKIGTSAVAILAKHYGIPFYVCAPLSTVDLHCTTGDDIHIELRPEEEITSQWYEKPMAPAGVSVYNPAFDVTDHELITAIVTQHGIAYPPFTESLSAMFAKDRDK
ncbi:S-methyl-5-thioribose-1-phosphate isomerase [Paenibacillus faecalis]|uniref:S-methyl-5-thioribose-1-phosphate isomerase n=1 Tax=Paenibacillus faecalis TaxID=2079532 RepID=UPI001F41E741|nr:S-methyl-5-thioribose-1-phosphate isomerase [Paenibacillus faecalis]